MSRLPKLILLIPAVILHIPAPVHAAPPPGSGWNLVWSDEFEGESLDLTKWQHRLTGPRRQAQNTPSAVKVANGNLAISTFTAGGSHYTGMVSSDQTFLYTYGYVEARINFDTSPGMWSAFWMQSPTMASKSIYDLDPSLAGTEIDICEHRVVNENGSNISSQIVGNIHACGYGADQRSTGYTSPNLDLGGGYHIYGMEWTPTEQKFYIDGVLRWTFNTGGNPPVSNRSEYLWLSSEVDTVQTDWAGPIPFGGYGSIDTTTTKMFVDYVRVYQVGETVSNGDFGGRLAPFEPTNEASWSSTGGRTQARAGKLAPTTAAGASLEQTLNGLMPNTGYTLTGYGNAGPTNPSLFLGVQDHGNPSTGQTLTGNAYAAATLPFTTGSSNRSATVVARSNNAGSVAYVDDFLLRRHASVDNGHLESEETWAWSSPYGGVARSSENSYDGAFSWRFPVTADDAGVEQLISGLSPGTAYRFTAWTNTNGSPLGIGVKNHGATQILNSVSSSAWTKATVNFTTGAANTSARVFAYRGSGTAIAYADSFFLSQSLASPWTAVDIGTVGLTGTSGRLGQKFVIQATGANISGGSDKCHLVHRSLSGDGTLTARILGVDVTSDLTKMGLMLRESTTANSRAVALTWNPVTRQINFICRSTAGAGPFVDASTSPGSVPTAPWLRLTRRGNAFTPYWSTDGVSWNPVDVPRTLTLNPDLLAGLAFATGDENQFGEAAFDNVSIAAAIPDVQITQPTDNTAHAANGGYLRLVATLTGGSGASILWNKVSGPGSVTFSDPANTTTHAAFSAAGIYQLRCSATNAAGTGSDDHTIHVTPLFAADPTLVLHLKLNESSGTMATDSSGIGNHGSTAGSLEWQPSAGKFGGAASLDGASAHINVPDHNTLDNTSRFTLSCWFKADEFRNFSALVAKRLTSESQNAYTLSWGTAENLGRLRIDINSFDDLFYSNTVFTTNTWHHVALVFDGTLPTAQRAKLYVNGVLDVVAPESSSTVINSTEPLLIGRLSPTTTGYFNGMIDNVRLHRRALSAVEIAGLADESQISAPFVSAGSAPAPMTNTAASLAGSVDVGTGPAATSLWTKVSGPGTAVFANAASPATSVTFNQAGLYQLRLTATSGAGQVYQNLAVLVAAPPNDPSTYTGWKELTWPGLNDESITGLHADPDKDGNNNLLEWALHLIPTQSDTIPASLSTSASFWNFIYTRRKVAPGEASFQVQWSSALNDDWTTDNLPPETIVSSTFDSETVKVTLPAAPDGKIFARLRVMKP